MRCLWKCRFVGACCLGLLVGDSLLYGDPCSGKKQERKACTDERWCKDVTNANGFKDCESPDSVWLPVGNQPWTCTDGVAGDNCIPTTADENCAEKYSCTFGVKSGETTARCYKDQKIGDVTKKVVQDGGTCSVPG